MTYTVMRKPLTKGKKRYVKHRVIEIERNVSAEVALTWIKAHLGQSAWVYVQDNDKLFTGKDER